VVYINERGQVVTSGAIDPTLQARTDIVGVEFWWWKLWILTASGDLYTEDGTLQGRNILHMETAYG
jgi:hypothetical protein